MFSPRAETSMRPRTSKRDLYPCLSREPTNITQSSSLPPIWIALVQHHVPCCSNPSPHKTQITLMSQRLTHWSHVQCTNVTSHSVQCNTMHIFCWTTVGFKSDGSLIHIFSKIMQLGLSQVHSEIEDRYRTHSEHAGNDSAQTLPTTSTLHGRHQGPLLQACNEQR